MSGPSARLLDLDAFVPRAVEVQLGGTVHRVPGAALTADLVIGLQELSQVATGDDETPGDETAVTDIIDLLGGVMAKAEPPLEIRSIPQAAIGPLAVFLIEASGMVEDEEPERERPTPARRRASSTTRPSRARTSSGKG